jgi:hypothetical protein
MAEATTIFDSPVAAFRLIESGSDPTGMAIDVHIISPGWGSFGFYSERVLQEACRNGVYPKGMHMHIDHPSRKEREDQPARTILGESPLAAIFTEAGHYEPAGWDGPGPYTRAKVLPHFIDQIRAMDGHIGISHYVSGVSEAGEAPDGKKGPIIKELRADPTNTVDFVTTPGANGHYRTMFSEMKVRADPTGNEDIEENMADKQESLTLSEVRTNHPEVFEEMKKTLTEELKIEAVTKDQTAKLTEAADKIKALEQENKTLRTTIAEGKARDYIAAELAKVKLPATSGKMLTESLVKQVVLAEDGTINAAEYGKIVTEAIKAKSDEIALILKETGTGIKDNGTTTPPASDGKQLMESYIALNMSLGKTRDEATRLAEIAVGGR